jgi:hypothetical protein
MDAEQYLSALVRLTPGLSWSVVVHDLEAITCLGHDRSGGVAVLATKREGDEEDSYSYTVEAFIVPVCADVEEIVQSWREGELVGPTLRGDDVELEDAVSQVRCDARQLLYALEEIR